jgi:hypothetical protein
MRGLLLAHIAGMRRVGVVERLAIDVLGVIRQVTRTEAGRSSFVRYGMPILAALAAHNK